MPKQPTLQPTPLLLAVLVLLWEAPMHPYQMQRTMRERGKDFVTDVKAGSIYHAVQRLEKAGLAEAIETTREGKRPERTTYRITDAGTQTCEQWQRDMLANVKPEQPEFTAALASIAVLVPDEAHRALAERIAQLDSEIASLEAGMREWIETVPRLFLIEVEYTLALRKAEAAWVRGLATDIAQQRLQWSHDELREAADRAHAHDQP